MAWGRKSCLGWAEMTSLMFLVLFNDGGRRVSCILELYIPLYIPLYIGVAYTFFGGIVGGRFKCEKNWAISKRGNFL